MAKCRYIFFDVGNTLLFPNRGKILAPVSVERRPTLEQWQGIERRTKIEFDASMQGGTVDHSFWWTFHSHLLESINASDDSVRKALIKNTQQSANWDQILPGTREILDRLARKFSIAVISNSDGKIESVLRRCGIGDCFATTTDSGNVGKEKPHPEIFRAGLEAMKADAEDSLYVGDIYSIDYTGAQNAGMQAVLLDVAGTYRDRGLPRVDSLAELEEWLAK